MKQATPELLKKFTKPPEKFVRALSNSWVTFDRCVAYCFKHHSYLTLIQLRNRQCLQKDCRHCMKVPNQYWIEKAEKRKNRNIRRRQQNAGIHTKR